MTDEHLRWIAVSMLSGVAALHDARSGHVPNWIVGVGLAFGVGAPGVILASANPLEASVRVAGAALGFVVCGAVPLLLFRLKAIGGGDVKLLATLGALLGPSLGLELSFAAFSVAAIWWPVRFVHSRFVQSRLVHARGEPHVRERLAVAFAPCSFIAAITLTAGHWRA